MFGLNIGFQLLSYLIIDNITKLIVTRNRKEYRFDILITECFILGFLIGYLSIYYSFPYVLLFFFLLHLLGTIYSSEKKSHSIWNLFPSSSLSSSKTNGGQIKSLPKEYLYNYRLKPTNDFRLQQTSVVPRPGILNIHGTTCSLNSLLQSFASFDTFYHSFQRNLNFSKYQYDPIISIFLDLLSQLRHDHRTLESKHWSTRLDPSELISIIQITYPNLLTPTNCTDICELFQCVCDLLTNSLAKQTIGYSTNVMNQVQNSKLTTYSLENLNNLFSQVESEIHEKITLTNLDSQTSLLIQYLDLTWLLHHSQLGSMIKQAFSGQILHAHCCNNCSHVRFRTEPFQILSLPMTKLNSTLEKLVSQLTKIEMVDSLSCSNCANQKSNKPEAIFDRMTTTLSPIVTSRRQYHDQIYVSTPIASSTTPKLSSILHRRSSQIKSQVMLSHFPEILALQLKRFTYDRLSNTTIKLKTSISIQPNQLLDLSSLHHSTWLGLKNASQTYPYRLIAVCLHLSDQSFNGHYVSLYRTERSQWFLSDDEHVTAVNQIDHLFQTAYVTENCYLLFYEKC